MKLKLVIAALFVAAAAYAQQPQAIGTVPLALSTEKKIALPPDVAEQVKQLKDAFDGLSKDEQLIAARKAQIQALLAAQFYKACARVKVDADEYAWSDDLTGLVKKPAPVKDAKPKP